VEATPWRVGEGLCLEAGEKERMTVQLRWSGVQGLHAH
jgi:hypothetical protein